MLRYKIKIITSIFGVDGSGKTTIAKELKKKIKNSQYLHLKPYILIKDKRRVVKNPHNQKQNSSILSLFQLIVWLISYRFFFIINQTSKVYIFDRYAHDILIDPIRYGSNLSKKLTKYILNFFPEPDLWIYLKPSIKTIKSRKIELSDQELKRQMSEYNKFFKNKKNLLVLNTNMKKNKIIYKILKKIKILIK
jgi:thymidylate kinase